MSKCVVTMSLSLMVHASCASLSFASAHRHFCIWSIFGKNFLPCPVEDMTESRMPGHSYMWFLQHYRAHLVCPVVAIIKCFITGFSNYKMPSTIFSHFLQHWAFLSRLFWIKHTIELQAPLVLICLSSPERHVWREGCNAFTPAFQWETLEKLFFLTSRFCTLKCD